MDPNILSGPTPDDLYAATMAGRIRDELIRPDASPIPSDFSWSRSLRELVIDGLGTGLAGIEASESLFVNKTALKSVLGCEVLHQCDTGFEWSVDTAKGTILNAAADLVIGGLDGSNNAIAAAAVTSASNDPNGGASLAEWLNGLDEITRIELVSEVASLIDALYDTWGSIEQSWNPRPGYAQSVTFTGPAFDVRVRGKADLVVGPRGGRDRNQVIVDWKKGRLYPSHFDEVWLYALAQTIRTNIAPARIGVVSLTSEEMWSAEVDYVGLEIAAERLIDGVVRIRQLQLPDTVPVTKPGPPCGWCPLSDSCPDAFAHLTI
jgi:hypothetical protein